MSITNTLSKIELPNIDDLIKSTAKAKNHMENLSVNKIKVHFLYSDGRFKQTIEGDMLRISNVPIVLINEPAKMGFLVLNECLIYDVTNQTFEIFVNEDFAHAANLRVLNTLDIHEKLKVLFDNANFAIPISTDQISFHEMEINIMSGEKNEIIKLSPSFLSGLARAKLLENTAQSSNDGLVIVGIIGVLIGFILGGLTFSILM